MPLECKHIGEPGNCRYCQMDAEIAALREQLATVERVVEAARAVIADAEYMRKHTYSGLAPRSHVVRMLIDAIAALDALRQPGEGDRHE